MSEIKLMSEAAMRIEVEGTSNDKERIRWQQGFKVGKNSERQAIIEMLKADLENYGFLSDATSLVYKQVIALIEVRGKK